MLKEKFSAKCMTFQYFIPASHKNVTFFNLIYYVLQMKEDDRMIDCFITVVKVNYKIGW